MTERKKRARKKKKDPVCSSCGASINPVLLSNKDQMKRQSIKDSTVKNSSEPMGKTGLSLTNRGSEASSKKPKLGNGDFGGIVGSAGKKKGQIGSRNDLLNNQSPEPKVQTEIAGEKWDSSQRHDLESDSNTSPIPGYRENYSEPPGIGLSYGRNHPSFHGGFVNNDQNPWHCAVVAADLAMSDWKPEQLQAQGDLAEEDEHPNT